MTNQINHESYWSKVHRLKKRGYSEREAQDKAKAKIRKNKLLEKYNQW